MTTRHRPSDTPLEEARDYLTQTPRPRVGAVVFSLVRGVWVKRIAEQAGFEFVDSPYDLNEKEVLVVPDVWPQGLVDLGLRAYLDNLSGVRGLWRVSSQNFTFVMGELVAARGNTRAKYNPQPRKLDL